MDVDKSLYMHIFRNESTLGTVINKPATDLFQINLYNDFCHAKSKYMLNRLLKK